MVAIDSNKVIKRMSAELGEAAYANVTRQIIIEDQTEELTEVKRQLRVVTEERDELQETVLRMQKAMADNTGEPEVQEE